jgi:hypothetical protein
LGLLFFVLPTQYNSLSRFAGSLKQYCLLKASAARLKIVAISQNNLRPFEIQKHDYITYLFPLYGDPAKREGVFATFVQTLRTLWIMDFLEPRTTYHILVYKSLNLLLTLYSSLLVPSSSMCRAFY